MATLAELQDALQNAHSAGDTQAATALANAIVQQRMPWAAPTATPIPEGPLSHLPAPLQAGIIGAGRTGSQIEAGNKQLGLNALIAGKQMFGLDTAPQTDALEALKAEQNRNTPIYDALKQQYPVSTSLGEAAPALAIPVGQATMAARILAPTLGMGTIGAAQYGDPASRAIRGSVNAIGGLAGGTVSEIAARAIQPVRAAASSAAQNAAKSAANQIGAPMLPSQQTGSPDLARIEDALARYPGSAGVMDQFLGRQRAAVNQAASKAIGETDAPTADVLAAAKARMGNQYDAFRAQIPGGLPVTQDVLDAVSNAKKALSQGSTQAPGKAGALSMLQELEDKLYGTKALTPDEYSGWVSDLASAAREVKNSSAAAQLKTVGATMDRVARGPLNPQWQQLDQAYSALKALQTPGIVNPQTGDVAAGRLAGLLERKNTGARATSLQDIADYARAVPNLRAGSPTAERDAVGPMGALNALWRYPLAKLITSDVMRGYLSNGLLFNPEASRIGSAVAGRAALPAGAYPALGLLNPLIPAYQ